MKLPSISTAACIALWPLVSGCSLFMSDKCEAPPNAQETFFEITYLNSATGQGLFLAPTRYSPDSVRVLNAQGASLQTSHQAAISGDRSFRPAFNFSLLAAGENPVLDRPQSRTFIIYLSRFEQDTLRAEYELFKNDCDKPQFTRLEVYYNNQRRPEVNSNVTRFIVRRR